MKTKIVLALFILGFLNVYSQKKLEVSGYLSMMNSNTFDNIQNPWTSDNLLHNRINIYYYPTQSITASLQLRNRFMWGDYISMSEGYVKTNLSGFSVNDMLMVSALSNYKSDFDKDDGAIDMQWNIADGKSYLLNSAIDRLWLQYTKGDIDLTIGRQRINWGQTWAFNPNDIFNTYSFFEVDYPERAGSDAIRLQYYTGMTSKVEGVVKMNHKQEITAAALWRFNKLSYDFQIISGILNEDDYVIGGGWSGNIKSIGFRGEMSYFHPKKNFSDTSGIFAGSVAAEYIWGKGTAITAEYFYTEINEGSFNGNYLSLISKPLSAKQLSFSEQNIMFSVSHPLTPLLTTTLAAVVFPDSDMWYLGPSLDYSLKENLNLSVIYQLFSSKMNNPINGKKEIYNSNMVYLRLKANF